MGFYHFSPLFPIFRKQILIFLGLLSWFQLLPIIVPKEMDLQNWLIFGDVFIAGY